MFVRAKTQRTREYVQFRLRLSALVFLPQNGHRGNSFLPVVSGCLRTAKVLHGDASAVASVFCQQRKARRCSLSVPSRRGVYLHSRNQLQTLRGLPACGRGPSALPEPPSRRLSVIRVSCMHDRGSAPPLQVPLDHFFCGNGLWPRDARSLLSLLTSPAFCEAVVVVAATRGQLSAQRRSL